MSKKPAEPAGPSIDDLTAEIEKLKKALQEEQNKAATFAVRLEAAVSQRNAEADRALMALADAARMARQLEYMQNQMQQPQQPEQAAA